MKPEPLDGVELVVFDKDGTLIDFQAMWGGWVRTLAEDLTRSTGFEVSGLLFDLLGVDRTSGLVHSHGLLAATPMARIREVVVEAVVSVGLGDGAAENAVAAAWSAPDPVELAHPLTDLPALFDALEARGIVITIATSDNREPTERTLAALGIADRVAGLVCADDGLLVKPAPDGVLHLCAVVRISPDRTAVVGDSPVDLAMGHAAGVRRVIGVLTGVGDRASLASADVVLESVADLIPG
ncbi:MAG TPA: HAD family hydrolase [Candidatus Limnocylindrales bacterium]|nr:HAD family hydrolase [Candidatus Limnocylindrales bacterium]